MNAAFLVFFTIGFAMHTSMAYRWKTYGFGIAMSIGCGLEISAYAGRILAYTNPWSLPAFFIQINGIGLAPTFFAAGIYLCLTRIVIVYGAEISLVQPKVYTYFFVVCDIVSLLIQAPGGALSSVSASQGEPPTLGAHIGVAGLAFQVFSLSVWIGLCLEFARRCRKVGRKAWDPRYENTRNSPRFKAFLVALGIATITLYARSIYRIIELSEGYTGQLAKDETAFCVLEGVMIVVTALAIAILHPGFAFGDGYVLITEQKLRYPRPYKRGGFFMKDVTKGIDAMEMSSSDGLFPRTRSV
ncbi:hypothetical protein ABW19_dt0210379 [Dactylella cylindrospora]|nr:hypothetical protein ABW19_dt0210379 [Dactylella cylindrospora]